MQVEDHREALEDIPVPQWAEHQGDGKRWLLLPSPPYLAPGTPALHPHLPGNLAGIWASETICSFPLQLQCRAAWGPSPEGGSWEQLPSQANSLTDKTALSFDC